MLGWSDLPGKRVGLYGLGVEGRASLRRCRTLGLDPVLVDDVAAADDPAVLATADGGLAALSACDVVIKSPGISRYGAAVTALRDAGVAVVGGLGLWLADADLTRVLVITGTKGKSTTTSIAAHLLSAWDYRCLLAGNIGMPPYDPQVDGEYDYCVVEVSSYQATDLPVTPPVTAVTSLHPDHLPWHGGDPETYFRDKLSALTQPGADVTVANGDSALLRGHADLLGPRVRWVRADDEPDARWMKGLSLLGVHNRRNALIAREALRAMGIAEAADDEALARGAVGFHGLASRLNVVGRRSGVTFVDDNLSTNVLPALAAVDAFADRRVALIVGGQSRGIDYAPLAEGLRSRTLPLLLVTVPTNGPDIHAQVTVAGAGPAVSIVDTASLDEAVAVSAEWADPDGVVLLSPAAPSFDLFRDYRARGEAFVAAMLACGGEPVTG
jgi:UDP-N-acetylmuramoylalanine--D-glutamate ligase